MSKTGFHTCGFTVHCLKRYCCLEPQKLEACTGTSPVNMSFAETAVQLLGHTPNKSYFKMSKNSGWAGFEPAGAYGTAPAS